jgi:hypothetical protein
MLKEILLRSNRIYQVNLSVLLSSILIFGFVSINLGQDVNWDQLNYHFYNVYLLIKNRFDYDYLPAQIQTFFNPVMHIPFYYFMWSMPPRVTGFLLGSVQGLNFFLIFLIAQRALLNTFYVKRIFFSLLCALTGISSPMFLSELGSTFGDNFTSLFVLLGVLLLILPSSNQSNNFVWRLFGSGFFVGISTGLKLTNLVYVISILFTVLVAEVGYKKVKGVALAGLGVLAGILLSSGYWMWILVAKYRSPLFPFYNTLFKSPYFPFVNWDQEGWAPKTFFDALMYPFLWAVGKHPSSQLPFRDLRWAIIFILLTAAVLVSAWSSLRKRNHRSKGFKLTTITEPYIWITIIVFTAVSYGIWLIKFGYQRYLIPLDLLSGIIIFYLAERIIRIKQIAVYLSIILCVVAAVTVQPSNWGRLPWDKTWFDIKVPAVTAPEKTMIIMISTDPISYVIPFFSEDIRFVRIEGNFDPFFKNTLFEREMISAINNHDGQFMLLAPEAVPLQNLAILSSYGFKAEDGSCEAFTSRLQSLKLCRLRRQESKA